MGGQGDSKVSQQFQLRLKFQKGLLIYSSEFELQDYICLRFQMKERTIGETVTLKKVERSTLYNQMWLYCVALKILLWLSSAKELHPSWPTMWCHQMGHSLVIILLMLCYFDIEDEHTVHHIFSKGCLKGVLISGAPNNSFLLNALKTLFRPSRVLLDL